MPNHPGQGVLLSSGVLPFLKTPINPAQFPTKTWCCPKTRPPTFSITSVTVGAAMVAGASSMIFWWRRWMEQSRLKREMALPYSSARTCTSRCRACCASCIRKMGDPGASACTCGGGEGRALASCPKIHPRMETELWKEVGGAPGGSRTLLGWGHGWGFQAPLTCRKQALNSSAASTFRMPLPPPPSAALIIRG